MLLSLCLFAGCSPHDLHEAQRVVAEADSLWQQGQMYDDSTQLAQTYNTFQAWRAFYTDEYAHACYHYGKLLRAKEDPVSAMQVFIDATHSRTHDYHILGRVYSNMGSICHIAGEFLLSYDMYEQSANMFLMDGDSIRYYYALNDMAFELAERGQRDSVFALIDQIEKGCTHRHVLLKTNETRSVACKKAAQYDSVLYYTSCIFTDNFREPEILLLRAQAYSFLGEKDSAIFYANMIVEQSNSLYHVNNALYILTNDTQTKDVEPIRRTAADRSDTQLVLSQRQGKLSQAVQLLEQDLNRKPDLKWLYAIITTIFIIGIVVYFYRKYQHRRHSLLSQKVEALSVAYSEIQSNKIVNIEHVSEMLRTSSDFTRELCWRDFNKMCVIADNHFYLLTTKLKQKQVLNEQEIRLCILILIDYNNIQIAKILSYAVSGVGKFKYRVAKKLGTDSKNLRKYLLYMAIDEAFHS